MNTNLFDYYDQRAAHYEDIYRIPERQAELSQLAAQLQQLTADKNVLEVACGTGYWTERYVDSASHVLATDASGVMLELGRPSRYSKAGLIFNERMHLIYPREISMSAWQVFGGRMSSGRSSLRFWMACKLHAAPARCW